MLQVNEPLWMLDQLRERLGNKYIVFAQYTSPVRGFVKPILSIESRACPDRDRFLLGLSRRTGAWVVISNPTQSIDEAISDLKSKVEGK